MYVEVQGKGTAEDVIHALKKLSKILKKDGILEEVYRRTEFVKPSKKRKMKRAEAIRRKKREESLKKKYKNDF
jgi:ribosomal protein S21